MTEAHVVQRSKRPVTTKNLTRDLGALGVERGDCLLVHASLSKMGWVCGGPVAVIEALLDVLGDAGTLVMPTHTTTNTEPSHWQNPPTPNEWWADIRQAMPAFDKDKTPSNGMGIIAETFRKWPRVLRSDHPVCSFAARGPLASELTAPHELSPFFGDDSPIGRLYRIRAKVLLIGVGHDSNTSLHLAEHRSSCHKPQIMEGCARMENGKRVWSSFLVQAYDTDDFDRIGKDFEATGSARLGHLGAAHSRLFLQPALVDFATTWLDQNRPREPRD